MLGFLFVDEDAFARDPADAAKLLGEDGRAVVKAAHRRARRAGRTGTPRPSRRRCGPRSSTAWGSSRATRSVRCGWRSPGGGVAAAVRVDGAARPRACTRAVASRRCRRRTVVVEQPADQTEALLSATQPSAPQVRAAASGLASALALPSARTLFPISAVLSPWAPPGVRLACLDHRSHPHRLHVGRRMDPLRTASAAPTPRSWARSSRTVDRRRVAYGLPVNLDVTGRTCTSSAGGTRACFAAPGWTSTWRWLG